MKATYLLLAAAALMVSCSEKRPDYTPPVSKTYAQNENLKGKVKKITEGTPESPVSTVIELDEAGNILKLDWHSPAATNLTEYTYNPDGNIATYKFTFDHHDYPTYEHYVNERIYEYNENGVNSKVTYLLDGKTTGMQTVTFDEQGYPLEYDVFTVKDDEKTLTQKLVNEYDGADAVKCRNYDREALKYIDDLESDGQGGNRVSLRTFYQNDKPIEYVKPYYDNEGRTIKVERSSDGDKWYKSAEYAFDAQGNCVLDNEYNPDGTVKSTNSYIYEYDKAGNWTKKTNKYGSTTREIEYY